MRAAFAFACILAASTAGVADVIVRQRTSTSAAATPNEETVYLMPSTIVTDSRAMRMIVDLDKGTITTADKAERTYTVTTFDQLQAQMAEIRKAIDALPPEVRERMAPLLDDTPVTLEATGKTDTIAGYVAKEHALRGGPYSGSIWTTDAIATPPAFQKWKAMEKNYGGAARRLSEAIEKLHGFPLRSRIETKTAGETVVLSNDVVEVREGSTPDGVRKIPPGFTKQPAPAAAPAS